MDFNAIFNRAKSVLLNPKETWAVIKDEANTVNQIYTEYVLILAAVPAIASLLGNWIFGIGFFNYRPGFFRGLFSAVISYLLTLVGVFVAGKIVDALAPSFNAQKNDLNAFKVVAYSWTAAWVAGILLIIPGLAPLVMLVSLYGFYLLYLGLPYLMECPSDKALGYTIVSVVVIFIVFIVISAIVGAVTGIPRGMMEQF